MFKIDITYRVAPFLLILHTKHFSRETSMLYDFEQHLLTRMDPS